MKIYVRATLAGPKNFQYTYPKFIKKFCKSEPCEYLESISEDYIDGSGACYGWDEGNYVERIEKSKDVFHRITEGTVRGDVKYVCWWEEGERYYLEVSNLEELFEIFESTGEEVVLYIRTEKPDKYCPTFGRPYLKNSWVLEIYDEYRE